MASASDSASASPIFKPWPARGCMVCAASPISTVLVSSPTYESAWLMRRGKEAAVPACIPVTRGGRASASTGGIPSEDEKQEKAEFWSIPCDCSRHLISSASCDVVSLFSPACDSDIRSCKYRTDISGNLKAALIMSFRNSGSTPPGDELVAAPLAPFGGAESADASGGLVDQTREETVGDKGRKAIGPVGRNL